MENHKIKAYKGFNKDMTCRGFQYEVGKEYEHEGDVEVCCSGFHACENPFDVLDHYGDILNNRYCIVEQSGKIKSDGNKTASSKIKINAEIGFPGLFKAGIEWLKEITDPNKVKTTIMGLNDNGGDSARIGSSGDHAQIDSTGEDSVICCVGRNSKVRAKIGSWITLSEWECSKEKQRWVPKCVRTEYVDGKNIKPDTWYKLVDGRFVECDD